MQQFGRELRAAAAEANKTGDTTQVDKLAASYESARRQVANMTRQLRDNNREIANTGTAAAAASRHLATMNDHANRIGSSLSEMTSRIERWGAAITAAAAGAVYALARLAKTAGTSLDNLDDMASATGTTTQEIEKLQLVARKAGDQGLEDINKALERTTKAMGAAQIEAKKLDNEIVILASTGKQRDFSDPFKAVGIDVRKFKEPMALMEEFARRIDRESNAAIKAALAADVFGKSWARVLPTMKNLREEMARSERDIAAGGGFTSQESIKAANDFLAALGKLEFQFGQLRDSAGAQLGAALTPAIQALSDFVGQNIVQINAWIVSAAGYIKALAGDLIRFFILGQPGQQTEWGKAIIDTLIYIQQTLIPGVTTAFQTMMGVLNGVASTINSIFGTRLTGGQVGVAIAIGQISGAFNTLAIAISAVGVVLNALLMLTPAGWLMVAIVGVGAAIVTLTGQWGALADAVMGAVNKIGNGLSWLWGKLKEIGGAFANMPAPVATGPAGFATGGLVPGRGSGDTVPAWLTPGEFVIRKSRVNALGADFFAQLNRGMGSLLPRSQYATGGLVTAGAGGGGTPVHLHLGGNSFALSGSENVVSALVVEARRHQVRSAGNKPSWYGGR